MALRATYRKPRYLRIAEVPFQEHNVVPHGPGHGGRAAAKAAAAEQAMLRGAGFAKQGGAAGSGDDPFGSLPNVIDGSHMKHLGGGISDTSTYVDPSGKKWVVKKSAADASGVNAELAAGIVMEGMGNYMPMPKSRKQRVLDEKTGDEVEMLATEFVGDATVKRFYDVKEGLPSAGKFGQPNRFEKDEARYAARDVLEGRTRQGEQDLETFDFVIGNADRHQGNYMVQKDGGVVAIDHDLAFDLRWQAAAPSHMSTAAARAIVTLKSNELSVRTQIASLQGDVGTSRGMGGKGAILDAMFKNVNELLPKAKLALGEVPQFPTMDEALRSLVKDVLVEHNVVPHGPGHGGRGAGGRAAPSPDSYAAAWDAQQNFGAPRAAQGGTPGAAKAKAAGPTGDAEGYHDEMMDQLVDDPLIAANLKRFSENDNITETYKYTDSGGDEFIVKKANLEEMGYEGIKAGSDVENEMGAQIVNDAMGIVDMPRSTTRMLNGERVLVTEFRQGMKIGDYVDGATLDARGGQNIAVFDTVIGNVDRHGANFLVNNLGDPTAIDHSLAFTTADSDMGMGNRMAEGRYAGNALSPRQTAALQTLVTDQAAVSAKLSPIVGNEATGAVFRRAKWMLNTGRMPGDTDLFADAMLDEAAIEEHNVVPHGPAHGGREGGGVAKPAAKPAGAAAAAGGPVGTAQGPGRTTRIRRGLRGEGIGPGTARAAAPNVARAQRDMSGRGMTKELIKGKAELIKAKGPGAAKAVVGAKPAAVPAGPGSTTRMRRAMRAAGATRGQARDKAPQAAADRRQLGKTGVPTAVFAKNRLGFGGIAGVKGGGPGAKTKAAAKRKAAADAKKQAAKDDLLAPNPDRAGKWAEVPIPGRGKKKRWMKFDDEGRAPQGQLEREMKSGWATRQRRDMAADRAARGQMRARRAAIDHANDPRKDALDPPETRKTGANAKEMALLDGDVSGIKNLGGGINTTLKGKINGADVIIKPVSGAHKGAVRDGIPWGNDHGRERAAYVLNGHLRKSGADVDMPTVVIRNVPGHGKSVVMDFYSPSKGRGGNTDQEMAFFDAVIGNTDRHGGNILHRPGLAGAPDKVVAIDHGLAFPTKHGVGGNYKYGTVGGPLSARQKTSLSDLKNPQLHSELTALVGAKATSDLYRRVNHMLGTGQILTTKGWGGLEDYSASPDYQP